jgi:ABC-type polysaccharide/polyol phosphate export permease
VLPGSQPSAIEAVLAKGSSLTFFRICMMFSKAIKDLSGGIQLFHVWFYQAYHEISAKYKRTIFGSLWIVGSMVFMSIAFSLVSSALFGQNLADTLPYVMAGIMGFNLVGIIFGEAPEVYLSNAGIISNHAYPFTYYTLESVTKNFMIFFHNVIVLIIILVLVQKLAIPHWSIVIALPVVFLNLCTWGGLVSMLAARFRDIRFLLPYMATIVMFCTPIMFKADQLKGPRRLIVDLNPLYPFIEMLRAPLLGHAMPMQYWATALGITVAGIILWLVFFNAFRNRISFWV